MRVIAALALIATLAACQTTTVTDDRFVRFFDEMAFGGGTDGAGRKSNTLMRWDGVWTWSVEGSSAFVEIVQARMSRILDIADMEGERVETGAKVRIIQDPEGTTYPLHRNLTHCKIQFQQRSDRILSSEIRIAVSDPETIGHCIDHELMHGLGFRFHSAAISSVMSPFHSHKTLSRWDVMAIRALMSPEMSAGHARNRVLAKVTTMLPALRIYAERDIQTFESE